MERAMPYGAYETAAATTLGPRADLVHRFLDQHRMLVGREREVGIGNPFDLDGRADGKSEDARALLGRTPRLKRDVVADAADRDGARSSIDDAAAIHRLVERLLVIGHL